MLAVGADQASIDRAQALGFKADPLINSEASDHTIVRFTVPPGLDAIRGQDLLSKELPGQRFELNRVYRLYRASAREEPVTLDRSLPPTVPGNIPTCAANRCFAREVMGWKDTLSQCARGLKVGVIDTDIDEAHPTFGGRHIHRFDFSPDGRLPAPNWHGTAVLSLLAGGPLTNTPGLIPDADFYAANVFYSDESGDMAADTISLLKALDWMKKFDVKLINMSFSGPHDALVGDAIARMSESGAIFVAAAGNEGPTAEPSYPGRLSPSGRRDSGHKRPAQLPLCQSGVSHRIFRPRGRYLDSRSRRRRKLSFRNILCRAPRDGSACSGAS